MSARIDPGVVLPEGLERLAEADGYRHSPAAAWPADPPPGETLRMFWEGGLPVAHAIRGIDGAVRRFPPAPPQPDLPAPAAAASVVICTRDRPDELARCLASLPNQTLRPTEIIVVDNASVDGRTREAALAAGVRYVREDRPGLDIARNTGAQAATAELVAFTDDDVVLHPGWLAALVAAFDDPAVGAVTGLVLPAELETPAQLQFETFWSFGRGYVRHDHTPAAFRSGGAYPAWEVGAGASMAFRRAVFETVGLFDERLDVGQAGCSGDSEYWYRLLAHGHICRYEPRAVAFHYHRRTDEGLASQLFHYMRGHAAALLVQHERTGLRPNLRRALGVMPRWFAGRALRRRQPRDRYLMQEMRGYASGIAFYWKRRRG